MDKEAEKIKDFFEKQYGKKLNEKEIIEINQNIIGFFKFLVEYDKKDKEEKIANKNGKN